MDFKKTQNVIVTLSAILSAYVVLKGSPELFSWIGGTEKVESV